MTTFPSRSRATTPAAISERIGSLTNVRSHTIANKRSHYKPRGERAFLLLVGEPRILSGEHPFEEEDRDG